MIQYRRPYYIIYGLKLQLSLDCELLMTKFLLVLGTSEETKHLYLPYFLCWSVYWSTSTQPAASAIGWPFMKSSGPIGGVACKKSYWGRRCSLVLFQDPILLWRNCLISWVKSLGLRSCQCNLYSNVQINFVSHTHSTTILKLRPHILGLGARNL